MPDNSCDERKLAIRHQVDDLSDLVNNVGWLVKETSDARAIRLAQHAQSLIKEAQIAVIETIEAENTTISEVESATPSPQDELGLASQSSLTHKTELSHPKSVKVRDEIALAIKVLEGARLGELREVLSNATFSEKQRRIFAAEYAPEQPPSVHANNADGELATTGNPQTDGVAGANVMAGDNELLSTKQAAEELGLSQVTISHYCRAQFPIRGIRDGRDWRVARSEVERYKQERKAAGRPPEST